MHEASGLLAIAIGAGAARHRRRRQECQALRSLLNLFPGQPLGDIEKSVKTILASSRTTLPALTERLPGPGGRLGHGRHRRAAEGCRQAGGGRFEEARGAALDLELIAKTKSKNVADLRQWLESGGTVKPLGAAAIAEANREFAGELPDLMKQVDASVASQVIERAEAAAKLKKDVFAAFAKLLGLTVSGSKPQMMKQLKDFVNRLAVSHGQTRF